MKHLGTAAVIIGLAAYAVAFYATPLPSVVGDAGRPLLRIELLVQLLLWPKEWLFSNWFGTPWECSLLDRLPVLLVAGAIVAWAAIVGWLLMVLCRVDRGLSRLELAVFATAVGLNALSTWVLLLGAFGVLHRLWMFTVPLLLTLGLAAHLWRNSRGLTARGNDDAECSGGVLSAHWLWLAAPFVLAILLAAMLPPLDFDVREYHLQAPKEFFQQGQITFLPHNVYANMALGTEMLSLLAMVISGDWWLGALAGKTVIAVFTLLCGLGLLAAGRRLFSPTAGVVAALVYLSIPWVTSIASGGFVEGASACYLFLAVYALLLSGARGTPSLLLAGYLAGGAVSTKYPALLFVLLPLAIGVLVSRPRCFKMWHSRPRLCKSPRTAEGGCATSARAFRACGVFLLAAAVGCGLWFAKSWVLTGNPTYPLLYSVFDGKTWSVEKERQWNRVHRPHDFSSATLGKDMGRIIMTSEWLSPLVMPLAALAFVGWWVRRRRRSYPAKEAKNVYPDTVVWTLLAYSGFVLAAWWLLTHRIDRFWIPVLPVLALLAGAGACWTTARWWTTMLAALLVVAAGANFLVAAAGQGNAWFIGLARLRHDSGWVDPWHEYFNTHRFQGRLLTVGDAAVFDLMPSVLYNTCFDDCLFEQIVKGRTAAEIRAELAARQIAYVYVDWGEIARYRRSYGFTDFVRPPVFDRLVEQGILEPLPTIEGHEGRGFRVKRGT
jgi:hypothetical protein